MKQLVLFLQHFPPKMWKKTTLAPWFRGTGHWHKYQERNQYSFSSRILKRQHSTWQLSGQLFELGIEAQPHCLSPSLRSIIKHCTYSQLQKDLQFDRNQFSAPSIHRIRNIHIPSTVPLKWKWSRCSYSAIIWLPGWISIFKSDRCVVLERGCGTGVCDSLRIMISGVLESKVQFNSVPDVSWWPLPTDKLTAWTTNYEILTYRKQGCISSPGKQNQ